MANDNSIEARGGLLPVKYPFGSFRVNLYKLTTSATTDVYIGQPMIQDANGQCAPLATMASNNRCLGPALGFLDTNKASIPSGMASLSQGAYLPKNSDAYVAICDDPNQLFVIQEDTGGSALTASNIGNTCQPAYNATSGSTVTGYSTVQLDRSTVGADTGGMFRLVALADYVNSDGSMNAAGNYGKWIVSIQQHNLGDKDFAV